jgi:hypothetical protein
VFEALPTSKAFAVEEIKTPECTDNSDSKLVPAGWISNFPADLKSSFPALDIIESALSTSPPDAVLS